MPKKNPRERLEIVARLLDQWRPGRLLDLGCGHGAFAVLAQGMGWKVTAVDIRTARMPMTRGIKWTQSDVRTFPIGQDEYDCIALLGLLYHLELKDQLELLGRCSHTLTIVDTHFSLHPNIEEGGYRGELFDEVGDRTPDQHVKAKTLSWGNTSSFWPDEESLLRMFADVGFRSVLRLTPSYRENRTFYVCQPEPRSTHVDETMTTIETARRERTQLGERSKATQLARRLKARSRR